MPVSFFLGYLERGLTFSIPFFLGFVYWLAKPNRAITTLYLQVMFGLVTATILVVQIENRYVYIFYPFLVVIGVVTVDVLRSQDAARKLSAYAGDWREPLRHAGLEPQASLCAVFLMTAMEPWKTWQGYNRQINTEQEFGLLVCRRSQTPRGYSSRQYPGCGCDRHPRSRLLSLRHHFL